MRVDFFADPICPWSWITSRWICTVMAERDLTVRWRSFSLEERDGPELPAELPAFLRPIAMAARPISRRALRIFEALRVSDGEDAVGRLSSAIGYRLFVAGAPPAMPSPRLLTEALTAAGLPASLEAEGDAPKWDSVITESMREAFGAVGENAMSPTVLVSGDNFSRAVLGPVLTEVPDPADSLRIWDAFIALAAQPAFSEIRIPRGFPSVPAAQVQ